MNSNGDERNQLAVFALKLDGQCRKKGDCLPGGNLHEVGETPLELSVALEKSPEALLVATKLTDSAVRTTHFSKAVTPTESGSNLASMNDTAEPVEPCKLADLERQDLANLVNSLILAISKPSCQQSIIRTINQLISHLLQNNSTEFNPQSLAKLIHRLRQATGSSHCREALGKDLDHPAALFSKGYLDTLTPQQQVDSVMHHIAIYILHRGLANFEPQSLIELLYPLSQGVKNSSSDCNPVLRAIDSIAAHLLQCNLASFAADLLDKLVYGFCKAAEGLHSGSQPKPEAMSYIAGPSPTSNLADLKPQQRTTLVVNSIAGYILQRDLSSFNLRQLANLLRTFGQVVRGAQIGCKQVLEAIDYIVGHILQSELAKFNQQPLIELAYSLHDVVGMFKGGKMCEAVDVAVDGAAENLYEPSPEHPFENLEQQQLINLVNNLIARYIFWRNLESFKPQQLVNLVKGLYKVPGGLRYKLVICALDHLAVHFSQCNWSEFKPLQLADLAETFLNIVKSLSPDSPVSGATGCAANPNPGLADLKPQQLSNLIKDYIATYISRRDLAKNELRKLARLIRDDLKNLNQQERYQLIMDHIATCIPQRKQAHAALLRLANSDGEDWECDLEELEQQQPDDPSVTSLSEQLKQADCAHGYVSLLSEADQALQQLADLFESELSDRGPQRLDNLVMNHIALYILQRDLADFGPHQLANLIKSFRKLAKRSDCKRVLEALDCIVMHLLQRDLGGSSVRAVANLAREIREASVDSLSYCQPVSGSPDSPISNLTSISQDDWKQFGHQQLTDQFTSLIINYILQRNLANFTSQQLASLACASSQTVENLNFDCSYPLRVMDRIAIQLSQRNLTTFEPQQLTRLADSFHKMVKNLNFNRNHRTGDPKISDNLTSQKPDLADRVMHNLAAYILQRDLANFKVKSLIHLIGGFCKVLKDPPHPLVVKVLDYLVLHLLQHDLESLNNITIRYILQRDLAGFDLRQLADLALGLSKRVVEPAFWTSALETVDHLMMHLLQRNLLSSSSQTLKNTRSVPKSIPKHELSAIADLFQGLNGALKALGPIELESVSRDDLAALDQKRLTNLLIKYVAAYISQRDLANFKLQQLINLVNVIGQVITAVEEAHCQLEIRAINCIAKHIPKCKATTILAVDSTPVPNHSFDNFTITDLVRGLSRVAEKPGCSEVADTLNWVARHILRNKLKILEPSLLIDLVDGFEKLIGLCGSFDCKPALNCLEAAAKDILKLKESDWKNFKPRQLAQLVNGLIEVVNKVSRVQDVYVITALTAKSVNQAMLAAVDHIAKYINSTLKEINKSLKQAKPVSRGHLVNFLAGLDSQTVATLACGLSGVVDPHRGCKHVLKTFSHLAKYVLQRVAEFEPQQLAQIINELHSVSQQFGNAKMRTTVSCISQHVTRRTDAVPGNIACPRNGVTDLMQKLAAGEQLDGDINNYVTSQPAGSQTLRSFPFITTQQPPGSRAGF